MKENGKQTNLRKKPFLQYFHVLCIAKSMFASDIINCVYNILRGKQFFTLGNVWWLCLLICCEGRCWYDVRSGCIFDVNVLGKIYFLL